MEFLNIRRNTYDCQGNSKKNKDFSDGVFGIGEYYLYNCIGHHHTWLLLECHLGLRLDPIDCKNIFLLLLLFIKAKQILKLEMVI